MGSETQMITDECGLLRIYVGARTGMSTVYAVLDTESEGLVGGERESACAWCVGALLASGTWRAERADKCVPYADMCIAHYTAGTFGAYWRGLDRDGKQNKRAFAKFAVGYLARRRAAEGRPISLVRKAGSSVFSCEFDGDARGAALDVANPAHVGEVLRVFFSADVVACGIVVCEFDGRLQTMKVLEEDYAVYRPSAEHKASAAARAVHGLGAAQLAGGRDVSELHERLVGILERYPDVVFVAHKAQFDYNVLVESIENRLLARAQRGDDAHTEMRLRWLRTALRDPRRWTCTWQRSVVLGSRVGNRQLADYRLPTVFEAVTETSLDGHHNA